MERRPSILGGPTARERRGSQPERKGSSWDRVRRGSFQVIGAVSAMRKMSMGAMAPASALTRRRRGSNAEPLTESDVLLGRCNTVHEQVRDEVRRALDSKTVGAAPLDRALALLDGATKLYEGARARMEEDADSLRVFIGEELFCAYDRRNERRPILWPVNGPAGAAVT